jgi:hypothetical protein
MYFGTWIDSSVSHLHAFSSFLLSIFLIGEKMPFFCYVLIEMKQAWAEAAVWRGLAAAIPKFI